MTALVTEPAPPVAPRLQRARGTGRIAVKDRDGSTVVQSLYQEGCAKIRLPHTHDPSLQAVLINTAGGLCGSDDLRWQADAVADTHLVLTTPACERVYRSTGDAAQIDIRLTAGRGARLDWLPQETILYQNANLERRIAVELGEGARFCAVEAMLLGREAMGESARGARLRDSWRVRRNGVLVHAEQTALGGSAIERDGVSLLDGANAFATILYFGEDAERRLEQVRALIGSGAGVSAEGERLVVRATANSGMELRRTLMPVLDVLCGHGTLPRLWQM